MNAAIRAVVRAGRDKGFETFGVRNGFNGLVRGQTVPLGSRDVSGIIQQGGTFLGSARCTEFTTREGRDQALGYLSKQRIDALVVIQVATCVIGHVDEAADQIIRLILAPLPHFAREVVAQRL